MVKKIEWSEIALADRLGILEYWEKRNGNKTYCQKLDKAIRKAVKTLAKNNFIGKKTDVENIRFTTCAKYLIFYRVEKEMIQIVRIWDSRRDPEDLEF